MPTSSKVFIFNNRGTSSESVDDLKELFTSQHIFPTQPDITIGSFGFNPAGLSFPTFVVPGGSTSMIATEAKPQIDKIRQTIGEKFNYVGVCAGAFLGTVNADLFLATYEKDNSNQLMAPMYLVSTKTAKFSLDVVPDYQAVGAFYPNNEYANCASPKAYMPHRVTLSTKENKTFSQLYLAGAGLFSVNSKATSESIATYADSDSYEFDYGAQGKKVFKHLSAIVQSKATENQGGRLLTGTHIEACVTNSKFLGFFASEGSQHKALSKIDYDLLINEQATTRAMVESILRDTLR